MSDHVQALRRAVDLSPEDQTLRLLLAEALTAAGQAEAAVVEYGLLVDGGTLSAIELTGAAGVAARVVGDYAAAARFLDLARAAGAVEGVEDVQRAIDALLGLADVASDLEVHRPAMFADVGGLSAVKDVLRMAIIEPLRDPERFRAFGRRAGGGVLLYGPPGCGKTLVAHATGVEAGRPSGAVRINDILSPFNGESERLLHDVFEEGRRQAPAVLTIDEIESIGSARARSGFQRQTLVDQLLHELDDREGLLVIATTNTPWAVDDAVARAGRFDTHAFVAPPDEQSRHRILELHLADKPLGTIDLAPIAGATKLFSGADLAVLIMRAADQALTERCDAIEQRHLEAALRTTRPTTLEWIATARRYVEFANRDGRWDDISAFVGSREART